MAWSTPKANTTARGYGGKHAKARAELLRNYQPGDPCCLCHHPMWPPTRNIHADHIPGTDQYRGLAHGTPCPVCGKRCNQSDGASRGAQIVNGGSNIKIVPMADRW